MKRCLQFSAQVLPEKEQEKAPAAVKRLPAILPKDAADSKNMELISPKIRVFEKYAGRYDKWYEKNKYVYESEIEAVRKLIPKNKKGIEIGVGTGRFAAPLGIKTGIEPSNSMGKIAEKRGIEVIKGIGESISFESSKFDFALMVTTVCFLNDVEAAFMDAWRILKPGGLFIVGLIDKESALGKYYWKNRARNPFYRNAVFYSAAEIIGFMNKTGFKNFKAVQTIFKKPREIKSIESVKPGYGEGSFVVIRGEK